MRIQTKIKPNAKENKILSKTIDETSKNYVWNISIKAPPEDNKANLELIKFLSKELKKKIKIVSGLTSKNKIIEILD